MGYDEIGLRFLLHAADRGVDYSNTATLGHLSLFSGEAGMLAALTACRGVTSPDVAAEMFRDCDGYIDGFLRYLGADHVESVDASDFEDATLVLDLNEPIPPEFDEQFSAVVEGGTLEHIFDFPTAIRNAMRMVRCGGHLILEMPVNNFAGHGFYQFSPELAFRVLSPQFGFRVLEAILVEPYRPSPRLYRVVDPEVAGHRIPFRSDSRTVLLVLAERIGPVPEFKPAPMQSDYSTQWQQSEADSAARPDTAAPSAVAPPAARLVGWESRTRRRVMTTARRAVPKRIERSGPVMRLKQWIVWFIPSMQLQPHYAADRRGFKRVHEPWTAPARLPRRLRTVRQNAASPVGPQGTGAR
jgi:hypothetical protein